MKMYLISDNVDTYTGMRLAGVDGVVVHEREETLRALYDAADNKDVAIILMTEKLVRLISNEVFDIKLNRKRPLIVEIPDRHATTSISSTISKYVEDAIGVRI